MNPQIKDQLNILSRLSTRKIVNGLRLLRDYKKAKKGRSFANGGLPISVSIEPTTSCNLRCPECPSGLRSFTRPKGMLDKDFFRKMVDELAPTLLYLTFYFQGEPYLNPDFLDMVKYAGQKKIYTATSTNGHYLTEENCRRTIESGLDRLIISIDGTTQDVYTNYRVGGKLEKVLEGTRRMIEMKKEMKSQTPHLIFQFLVVRPNEHQIGDVQRLAKEIGVDELRLKTAQVYDYKDGNPLIPTIDKYSRYRQKKDGTWEVKNKLANQCWKMWQSCVITWDGLVVPCCFDKDATHQLGDLKTNSFKEIWNGGKYLNFRRAIARGRSEIDICKNCSEGTKVWA